MTPAGVRASSHINEIAAKVPSCTVIADQRLTGACSNFSGAENENSGACAGATGAKNKRLETASKKHSRAPRNAISAFAKDSHKRAAKLLGYGLILDTPEAWQAVASVWAARLTPGERAAILLAALHSLHPGQAEAICEHAFNGVAQ